MKNIGVIVFLLATVGSYVTGSPAFSNERRAVLSNPIDIAARALELVPRVKVGSRAANETDNAARSLVTPRAANSSDENEARSLFVRRSANSSKAENERRAPIPRLRRGNFAMRAVSNETSV
ncbi:hypothetical protein F4677DRAFT_316412 [Hypoxylon crocopeplum]|nr:hypothetical protein F4677DRAFT_316412 [Hypoxylon crocopeplum]